MRIADCIYPECQIKGKLDGTACKQSCPFEATAKSASKIKTPTDEDVERLKARAKKLGLVP